MALFELLRQNIVQSSNTVPSKRMRRLRTAPALRAMVRETELNPRDFIYPLFVRHGSGRNEIRSMPGIFQLSVEEAVIEAQSAFSLGIPALMLFGIPAQKDPIGLENFSPDGIVQQALRAIKKAIPVMIVMTDVCMCEYTDHGHCGIINSGSHPNLPEGYVLNDETLDILARVAVSHAQAGADVVATSRRQEQVEETAAQIEAVGKRTVRATSDVTDELRKAQRAIEDEARAADAAARRADATKKAAAVKPAEGAVPVGSAANDPPSDPDPAAG